MGKRSNMRRMKSDLYRTPFAATLPLVPHLPPRFRFACPAAGNGQLADHLQRLGGSAAAMIDIKPGRGDIQQGNALTWTPPVRTGRPIDFIIENPPWTREILHLMIWRYSAMYPTWFLFDADWMHTIQAKPYLRWCRKVVSIGRVKWFTNSKNTGKDNCAWYLFDQRAEGPTILVGR